MTTSTFDGIVVDLVNNYRVTDNDSERNSGPGIGIYDGAQSNTITNNDSNSNKDSGILLDWGTQNNISNNHVRSNGTAGPDTTDGLRVNSMSMNNTLQSNFMKSNVTLDCEDNSGGAGTAGTANFWINDRGDTSKPPGICRPSDSGDQDDVADQSQSMQVKMAAGWDPNYAWYATDPLASELSSATPTVQGDTQSILQLLPQLSVPRHTTPIPAE